MHKPFSFFSLSHVSLQYIPKNLLKPLKINILIINYSLTIINIPLSHFFLQLNPVYSYSLSVHVIEGLKVFQQKLGGKLLYKFY